jgi:hypothetical protein
MSIATPSGMDTGLLPELEARYAVAEKLRMHCPGIRQGSIVAGASVAVRRAMSSTKKMKFEISKSYNLGNRVMGKRINGT